MRGKNCMYILCTASSHTQGVRSPRRMLDSWKRNATEKESDGTRVLFYDGVEGGEVVGQRSA